MLPSAPYRPIASYLTLNSFSEDTLKRHPSDDTSVKSPSFQSLWSWMLLGFSGVSDMSSSEEVRLKRRERCDKGSRTQDGMSRRVSCLVLSACQKAMAEGVPLWGAMCARGGQSFWSRSLITTIFDSASIFLCMHLSFSSPEEDLTRALRCTA